MPYISKELSKPMVHINKELHWVFQNWDDIMAFMMCGTDLNREVYTSGDLLYAVQHGIGIYAQTLQNKGKSSGRAPRTSTKTTFTIESVTEQGTWPEQQDAVKDLGDKNIRENNLYSTTTQLRHKLS